METRLLSKSMSGALTALKTFAEGIKAALSGVHTEKNKAKSNFKKGIVLPLN